MNGLRVCVSLQTTFSSYHREIRHSLTKKLTEAQLQSREGGATSGREGEERQRERVVQGREKERERGGRAQSF